jgi:hypothetical protein
LEEIFTFGERLRGVFVIEEALLKKLSRAEEMPARVHVVAATGEPSTSREKIGECITYVRFVRLRGRRNECKASTNEELKKGRNNAANEHEKKTVKESSSKDQEFNNEREK